MYAFVQSRNASMQCCTRNDIDVGAYLAHVTGLLAFSACARTIHEFIGSCQLSEILQTRGKINAILTA